jgi:hypothetical protein
MRIVSLTAGAATLSLLSIFLGGGVQASEQTATCHKWAEKWLQPSEGEHCLVYASDSGYNTDTLDTCDDYLYGVKVASSRDEILSFNVYGANQYGLFDPAKPLRIGVSLKEDCNFTAKSGYQMQLQAFSGKKLIATALPNGVNYIQFKPSYSGSGSYCSLNYCGASTHSFELSLDKEFQGVVSLRLTIGNSITGSQLGIPFPNQIYSNLLRTELPVSDPREIRPAVTSNEVSGSPYCSVNNLSPADSKKYGFKYWEFIAQRTIGEVVLSEKLVKVENSGSALVSKWERGTLASGLDREGKSISAVTWKSLEPGESLRCRVRAITLLGGGYREDTSVQTPIGSSNDFDLSRILSRDTTLLVGPGSGTQKVWTKKLASGTEAKFYVKYPSKGSKIEFQISNGRSDYKEVAWVRIGDDDIDSSGSYISLPNGTFVRTVALKPGKNRLRILVDGVQVWGPKTYSR